jgi:sensor histidine kinase YesM
LTNEKMAMVELLIFSNQRRYVWARHGLFWLGWLLFFTYIYAQKFVTIDPWLAYLSSFWEAAIYLPIHIGLSYLLIYVIIPEYLLRSRYLAAVLFTVAGFLLSGLASHFFTVWFVEPLRESMGLPNPKATMFFGLMAGLRGSNTVAGFAGTIKLLKYWYRQKIENETLQKEKLSAELHLLKAQLHPHFLFNTLNNLYSHILNDSRESGDIVLKLSRMLNYMLYECTAETVPLEGEVEMLKNYVDLEKLRYGDRLDVSFKVSGVEPGHRVAPLLLLPFVENAFKHGASQLLEQAWISVGLTVQGDQLALKVINPLPPSEEDSPKETGIGLQNVRKRLHMLYPTTHTLKITREEELFVVTLKLAVTPVPSLHYV